MSYIAIQNIVLVQMLRISYAAGRAAPVRPRLSPPAGCSASGPWPTTSGNTLLNLDETASLRDLVTLVRSRWPIEQQYRELKDDLGIDHFEGRSYRGWVHHTVLTAMAFTFLQLERRRSAVEPRPTLPHVRLWVREIMAVLYVVSQRNLWHLIASFQRNPPLRR